MYGNNICGVESKSTGSYVQKMQPYAPPSPGAPPSLPPSPPTPPQMPPPPIHPLGPIPDAIGSAGLEAPIKLDGATNSLTVRLNDTVGGDKPGLTVAMFVKRANFRNKQDVLLRIGSVRVSFDYGMTISTSTKSLSELEGDQASSSPDQPEPLSPTATRALCTRPRVPLTPRRSAHDPRP